MVLPQKPTLPVRRGGIPERIISKVQLNPVTLIYGATGCGKSSQVPQILLEAGVCDSVLCTQPRRLAVVALAKRMAEVRSGGEGGVPYWAEEHVDLPVVFATCGILLEELRANGPRALERWGCVILDEVHERSVESDLVLACIRLFVRNDTARRLRIVLMCATADFARYQAWFKEALSPSDAVELIAIPDWGAALRGVLLQTQVKYLEHVASELRTKIPQKFEHADAQMDPSVQSLVCDLILHLHAKDRDPSHTIMVFLPTYNSLELQSQALQSAGKGLKVYALHSSIDIDQCIRAMEASLQDRKVVLATNIAESSITIAGVYYVIDLCRTNQLAWNLETRKYEARVVWASRSQADQRKGRTGRTCDGIVYRLVPRAAFLSHVFPQYEPPALRLSNLHKPAITLICSQHKLMSDPGGVFGRCMDPPAPEFVVAALDLLVEIGAAEKHVTFSQGRPHVRLSPTVYGRLLADLPMSLDASRLVIRGASLGLLKPCAILATLMEASPYPIMMPFGRASVYLQFLASYGAREMKTPETTRVLMVNLDAYNFWQSAYKEEVRFRALLRHGRKQPLAAAVAAENDEWCREHYLIGTALRGVEDSVWQITEVLHRFRPNTLPLNHKRGACLAPFPAPHLCKVGSFPQPKSLSWADSVDSDGSEADFAEEDHELPSIGCTSQPFVPPGGFEAADVSNRLAALLAEARASVQKPPGPLDGLVEAGKGGSSSPEKPGASSPVCSFFQLGRCRQGNACRFAHTNGRRAECRFFSSAEGCRFGAACRFEHPVSISARLLPAETIITTFADVTKVADLGGAPSYWGHPDAPPTSTSFFSSLTSDDTVLLLGEGDFAFAEALSAMNLDATVVATSKDSMAEVCDNYRGAKGRLRRLRAKPRVKVLHGVDATELRGLTVWPTLAAVVWNFPFTGTDEDPVAHREMMGAFFRGIAHRLLVDCVERGEAAPRATVLLTLCNDQFSRWRVEQQARQAFCYLTSWWAFDVKAFPGYTPRRNATDDYFSVEIPVTFCFEVIPPTDNQVPDWRKRLKPS